MMWAQYVGQWKGEFVPLIESKSITNQRDIFHLPDGVVLPVWWVACQRDQGAVRGAEQVWESHSGTSTHFCCVAAPIDSHSFLTTFGTSSNCWKVWVFVPEPHYSPLLRHLYPSPLRAFCHFSELFWIFRRHRLKLLSPSAKCQQQ